MMQLCGAGAGRLRRSCCSTSSRYARLPVLLYARSTWMSWQPLGFELARPAVCRAQAVSAEGGGSVPWVREQIGRIQEPINRLLLVALERTAEQAVDNQLAEISL